MKKLLVLAALLAVAFVLLYRLPMFHGPGDVALTQPAPAPAAPAPAASAPAGEQVAQAPQTSVEEVHESPDTETTLERIIPRSSFGHSQGLNKTPNSLGLRSSAVLVMDAKSKEVLHAKNPDAVLPMASITKLMTAMVLLDQQPAMDQEITITEDDVDRQRSSRSRLRVGSVLTRSEALKLALMSSENRASHALARTSPQGLQQFVQAMNRKAKQLGMTNTQFVDPTGLSELNHATAKDLARMVLAASGYPLIREYSTTPQHIIAIGKRMLQYRNSDPLIKDGSWDIELQKTGYIIEAGHSVVLRTNLAGKDIVMVLLDGDGARTRVADAQRIRRWIDPQADARAQAAAKRAEQQRIAEARAAAAAKKKPPAKQVAARNDNKQKDARRKDDKPVAKAKAAAQTKHAATRKKDDDS